MNYKKFLQQKREQAPPSGFTKKCKLHPSLFAFQAAIVRWALKRGKAAIWADCGLGKTRMAIEWGRIVSKRAKGPVLILTPLAVAHQFHTEGEAVGVDVRICREDSDVGPGLNCLNYERLHKVDHERFGAIVADESSILKDYTSATRNTLIESFARTPYRLALTATPAPNDVMELGNHAQFLSVMTRTEMLSKYFVHDGGEVQKWRLKRHATGAFWRFVASWAVALRMPSDIGHDDTGYDLPALNMHHHTTPTDHSNAKEEGLLFHLDARTLHEQRAARRESLTDRVAVVANLANHGNSDPWIVWCDLNVESEQATKAINGAVEVRGSQSIDEKERRLAAFTAGTTRVLVTKPSIAGHGMNWQHCPNVAFLGISHSFEKWYQAIRRSYRFGQTKPVHCHIISSDRELGVTENLERKRIDAEHMIKELSQHVSL